MSSQPQNNQMEVIIKQLRDQGYKVTEEFSGAPPGQLSKVNAEHPPRKTWWDWLQLLILPLLIFSLGVGFTWVQNQASDRHALDQQQETILKTYLDNMSDLMFQHGLAKSQPGDEANELARARTLTALRRLDERRKGLLIQFLSEAYLITSIKISKDQVISLPRPIISLATADLSGADLSRAILSAVVLSGADLRGANLSGAKLSGAHLSGAQLYGATLRGATLEGTNLRSAHLDATDLRDANLYGADLRDAELRSANLSNARLDKTILAGARYNTKEIVAEDQGKSLKLPLTQWPQGFDPKAAGATERNTFP